MEMMSPERQLVSPFFLGGDTILVSYPTDTMTYEQRMMSMRGNNPTFSHATVFHELIPGHLAATVHERPLPAFTGRLVSSRLLAGGQCLYWEMLYLGPWGTMLRPQQRSARSSGACNRCARVIFSLSFHLGAMTPQQAIDFLVSESGPRARQRYRRGAPLSVNGDYDPLYQCSYMLGALQFRALRHELVDSGKMTSRQYHERPSWKRT